MKEFCINGWSVCAIVVRRPMRVNGNPGKWPIERIGFVSLGWQTAELCDWWQSRSAGYFFNVFDFVFFFWPLSDCRIQSWIELEMSCNWSDAQTERIIHRDTLHKRFTKWVRVFFFNFYFSDVGMERRDKWLLVVYREFVWRSISNGKEIVEITALL